MKLLDQIRRHGKFQMPRFVMPSQRGTWARHLEKLGKILNDRDLPAILIDNVADYFYIGTDQEHWDLQKHFPNLAPPFPIFWMEYRLPKYIRSEIGDTRSPFDVDARVGWLMFGATREEIEAEDIPEGTKWCVMGELFIDYGLNRDGSVVGPHGTTFLTLDENGQIIDRPGMMSYAHESMTEFMRMHIAWWNPALLGICFMHCKNVLVADEPQHAKHAKAVAKKNGGVQPVRFKRLIIEPLKQILRREGGSDKHGVAHAMHICRGHFKDYREGKGLFGKYHQVVWHPMSVRGTKGTKPAPREIEIKI
jgi:hypothetical protein